MKKLLAISIALNLALAVWLGLTIFPTDQAPTAAKPAALPPPAPVSTPAIDTSSAMELYDAMLQRGMAQADAKQLLATRLVAEANSAATYNYWQTKSVREGESRLRRYDSLQGIRASLREKFGPEVAGDPAFAAIFFPNAGRWSYLPAEVHHSLEQTLMEDLRKRVGAPESFGVPKISAEADAAIRNVLSEEQFFEYSLRESALAEQVLASGFDFNEKEFRGVFSAWSRKAPVSRSGNSMPLAMASGMPDADPLLTEIRGVLGERRYSEYIRTQDPLFKMLEAAIRLYPVSNAKRDQAYAVIRDTKEKAQAVLASGPIVGKQSHQALLKLKLDRSRNLAIILGDAPAELLERSMGPLDSMDVGVGLMPVVAR